MSDMGRDIAERIIQNGTLAFDDGSDLTIPFATWAKCVLLACEYLRLCDAQPKATSTPQESATALYMPDDVSDAFESFKLAIIRHKNAAWSSISQEQMRDCLKMLIDVIDSEELHRDDQPF